VTTVTPFSASEALAHVRHLSTAIAARPAGSYRERAAASYIASRLAAFGYTVRYQAVRLPHGRTSKNVIAVKKGATPNQFILGAHYDSVGGSPGANDNGSGTGVLLELARVLKDRDVQPTIQFVFFCAEELGVDRRRHLHHWGSHAFVSHLSRAQRSIISGMMSVDMVGYGSRFHWRTIGSGPQELSRLLRSFAYRNGFSMSYLRDPLPTGQSDHEPFELAGVPVSWIQWRSDPTYHSRYDAAGHIRWARLDSAGSLLEKLMTRLSRKNLQDLRAANRN